MFAVGDQVEVVGELDRLGDLLQDVDTETFAAALDVNPRIPRLIAGGRGREGVKVGEEEVQFIWVQVNQTSRCKRERK